jgi:citrate lyase subunit beta/citryl-CoA lyase
MSRERPVWRSLQYVPAHVEKFVASAHTRGADAIILDLEDSVPPEEKARARALVAGAAERVGQAGADVLVRINQPADMAAADIAAAVGPKVAALYLPKIESAADIGRIEALVEAAEARQGLAPGHTGLVALIESAAGFLDMVAIARASPRVLALSLGAEDFCLDVGMVPAEETLTGPRQQLIIAAAAAGVMALGVIGMATSYADPEAYLEMARRSRRFGFSGSSAIHPSQIPLLNEAFSPSQAEIDHARRVVDGYEAAVAAGRGAFAIDGRMIDAPIVMRARQLLGRHAAIEARAGRAQSPSL